jgi:hypothetical protein
MFLRFRSCNFKLGTKNVQRAMTRDETIFLSSTWHEMNSMSNCSTWCICKSFFLQLLRAETTCIKSLVNGLKKGELHHGECKKNIKVLISYTCDKEILFLQLLPRKLHLLVSIFVFVMIILNFSLDNLCVYFSILRIFANSNLFTACLIIEKIGGIDSKQT